MRLPHVTELKAFVFHASKTGNNELIRLSNIARTRTTPPADQYWLKSDVIGPMPGKMKGGRLEGEW